MEAQCNQDKCVLLLCDFRSCDSSAAILERWPTPLHYPLVFIGSVPRLKHPLPSARKGVRGRVCGASSQAGLLFLQLGQYQCGSLGSWESWEPSSRGNLRNRAGASAMLGRACVRGKVCRAYLLWSLVILPRLAPPYPWWSEGSPAAAAAAAAEASSSNSSAAPLAPSVLVFPSRRRRSAHQEEGLDNAVLHVQDQLANSAVE